MWFEKWVIGKRTVDEIAEEKGCSSRTIHRLFKIYLDNPPIPQIKENNSCHLMIDGTYFGDTCLLNYFDNDLKHLQYFELVNKENYIDFKMGLELLTKAGLYIKTITSDGDRGLIMAINDVLPHVAHQRCLVHIQRMALAYLTRNPKYLAGKELREIILDVHRVNNHEEKKEWIQRYYNWETKYYDFLLEKSDSLFESRLYKHYKIRQTRSIIKNALPNMFHYLDDIKIPKTNNGLESRFSYLKNNLQIHRGLSKKHRKSFLLWYNWFRYNK
ncbi:MAG: transposase [Parcubacteria group bacterium]